MLLDFLIKDNKTYSMLHVPLKNNTDTFTCVVMSTVQYSMKSLK